MTNQTRIYHVTLTDGTTFHLAANLAEAAAPLTVQWPGQAAWQATPWCRLTRGNATVAAGLIARGRGDTAPTVAHVEALEDDAP
jgi:hypothetical protein